MSVFFEGQKKDIALIIVNRGGYKIDKDSLIMQIEQKETISIEPKVRNAKWESSDIKVATVDKHGVITAISEGKCSITCKVKGEIITCSVEVVNPTEDKEEDTLPKTEEDDSASLTVSI